jgi:succinyl-CoA synthetase alpha subunit
MLEYGTRIVAGVTPGKGGTRVENVPVYDSGQEAQDKHHANAAIIFVPAPFAADAALEAMENGMKTIVIITEHIPIKDAISVMANYRQQFNRVLNNDGYPALISLLKKKVAELGSTLDK